MIISVYMTERLIKIVGNYFSLDGFDHSTLIGTDVRQSVVVSGLI